MVHSPNSRIHKLIENGDSQSFNSLRKILSKGRGSLCLGQGLNCFTLLLAKKSSLAACKKLLALDPAGVNATDAGTFF